jgi:hypothetical protein
MIGSIPGIRDRAILGGWIAGFLIVCALIWNLTRPLQTRYLLRTVNRVFIDIGDSRRISSPLARQGGKPVPMGYWFSMLESADRMFVFGVMQDGILIPCGAIVSLEGKVKEIIPLSGHARQILHTFPAGIMGLYIRRIEAAGRGGGK